MKWFEYFFVNIIDYYIIYKYFRCFSKDRRFDKKKIILIFLSCVLIISIVNSINNPLINLVANIILVSLYGMTFKVPKMYHMVLPLLYFGLGFMTELIGYFGLTGLRTMFKDKVAMFISMLLCELIRYIIVYMLSKVLDNEMPKLSARIIMLLVIITLTGIFVSCLTMHILNSYDNQIGRVLCMLIILMTMLNNIFIFELFNNVVHILSEKNRQELLLQEAKAKDMYYKQVEKNNNNVREIKHDLKNRLLAINMHGKNCESNEVKKIITELEESDKNIYTANVILNTILDKKITEAENKNIKVYTKIFVPNHMNIGYDDLGIIIGNLLDNSIEANEKLDINNRMIDIYIKCIDNILIIKIVNNKQNIKTNINKTDKKDSLNHGIGISSIKKITGKYNGAVEFIDEGNKFEADISLYVKKNN